MKKMILIMAILAISSTAMAADVLLPIVVPEAYVARTSAAMIGLHPDCALSGLTAKQCAIKHIRLYLLKEIRKYERNEARIAADATITDIELECPVSDPDCAGPVE